MLANFHFTTLFFSLISIKIGLECMRTAFTRIREKENETNEWKQDVKSLGSQKLSKHFHVLKNCSKALRFLLPLATNAPYCSVKHLWTCAMCILCILQNCCSNFVRSFGWESNHFVAVSRAHIVLCVQYQIEWWWQRQ